MKLHHRQLIALVLVLFTVLTIPLGSAMAQSYTKGTITGDNVALRKAASSSSTLICRLSAGTVVKILSTNVNAEWDKVSVNGKTGYVNRMYVSLDLSYPAYDRTYTGTIINCKENVNVRSSASKSGKILGTAALGSEWTVTGANCADGWHQIDYNGKTGYISSAYVALTAKAEKNQLTSLSVSGGTMTPAFSPDVYGYVVRVTSDKVTLKVSASGSSKVSINGNGKASYTFSMPSSGSKTVRISVGGKERYTIYFVRGALICGTWNIKRGNDKLVEQGRLIEAHQPDVLALQEVYRTTSGSNKVDNLLSLRTKDLQYTSFAASINYSGGGQYGIGILSRYKLESTESWKLESGSYEQRIVQKAVITVDGKKVSLYNTHFSYNSASIRKKQFAAVLKLMNADTNPYKILFGDFNAKASEFSQMKGYTVVNTASTQYLNYSGGTINKNEIDNILVSSNITVLNSIMADVELSDHKPLFAFLVLD